jgi:hypothetical protein
LKLSDLCADWIYPAGWLKSNCCGVNTTHPKADIEAWIHANARQAEREVDLALDIADTAVIHLHGEYLKKSSRNLPIMLLSFRLLAVWFILRREQTTAHTSWNLGITGENDTRTDRQCRRVYAVQPRFTNTRVLEWV